ncbi:MAG: DMT family transporter [Epsilonproteobacteria bacterium]|nr:DMT family transporter [Campylobacterota bacterium]
MSEERKGELFAVALSFFEGLFPIWSIIAVREIGPIHTYASSLVFALIFFLVLSIFRKTYAELFKREALKDLLLTSFYITLLFVLLYVGLVYTSASSMSVILLLQIFFSYLYFNIFGGERMDAVHTWGVIFMGVGALIVLFPGEFRVNRGDLLVLIAAMIAPIANLYQKRAREKVSSETVLLFRSIFALAVLIVLARFFEKDVGIEKYKEVFLYLFLSGFFVLGLAKIFWIEALHRISITKLSAMASMIPLFTLVFSYFILDEIPTPFQLFGAFLIIVGSVFITRQSSLSE